MSAPLAAAVVLLVIVAWLRRLRARPGSPVDRAIAAEEAVRQGRRGGAKLASVAADPTRYLNLALLLRLACELAAGVAGRRTPVCAPSTGPGRRSPSRSA